MRLKRPKATKELLDGITARDIQRLLSKVKIGGADECWPWQAHVNVKGYGQFRMKDRAHWAHRIIYSLFKGDIPAEMHVHHQCHNAACMNPLHMELTTASYNSREGVNHRWHGNPNDEAPDPASIAPMNEDGSDPADDGIPF